MSDLVCNYATIRFLPYRESGEFVNVGVVAHCPQTGFFDFQTIKGRSRRVRTFFPELPLDTLRSALSALRAYLTHQRNEAVLFADNTPDTAQRGIAAFQNLLRRRESILQFADAGSVLTIDPKAQLEQLYDHYVNRSFTKAHDYQEVVMRKRIKSLLADWNLCHLYKTERRVGNADYHVTLPFVHLEQGRPIKAIKPLDLDRPEPTEVYNRGDEWLQRFRRLRKIDCMPRDLILTVRLPSSDHPAIQTAAADICDAFRTDQTHVVPIEQTAKIRALVTI